MTCTRCDGTGFLNIFQINDDNLIDKGIKAIMEWMQEHDDHDVMICDCCGNGEDWYGDPGEHYGADDPEGHDGPYRYNGGLCECH